MELTVGGKKKLYIKKRIKLYQRNYTKMKTERNHIEFRSKRKNVEICIVSNRCVHTQAVLAERLREERELFKACDGVGLVENAYDKPLLQLLRGG